MKAFHSHSQTTYRKAKKRVQKSDSDKTYHLSNLFPQDKLWWARFEMLFVVIISGGLLISTLPMECTHEWMPLKKRTILWNDPKSYVQISWIVIWFYVNIKTRKKIESANNNDNKYSATTYVKFFTINRKHTADA